MCVGGMGWGWVLLTMGCVCGTWGIPSVWHCLRMDVPHGQSPWRWEGLDAWTYEGFGVSGPQGKQQRTPSMRSPHLPPRRSTLPSLVLVSGFVADTQGSGEGWGRGRCWEPSCSRLGHRVTMISWASPAFSKPHCLHLGNG